MLNLKSELYCSVINPRVTCVTSKKPAKTNSLTQTNLCVLHKDKICHRVRWPRLL
jgi:hypothetical protein